MVEEIKEFAEGLGLEVKVVAESSIKGAKGNKEFMIRLVKPQVKREEVEVF